MIYALTRQQFMHESIQSCTLQDCIDYCMSIDEVSVDTETKGFDPHSHPILSIQLGDENRQYFIEWEPSYSTELLSLFQDKTKTFLFHNAKFDLKFLRKNNLLPDNIYDTMLAEAVLKTGYPSEQRNLSLKGVVKHYLGVELDKSVRGEIIWRGITPEVIIYGANDIKYLSKVKELQMSLITKWELNYLLDTLENVVVKVFAKMEYDGITLDPEIIKEVASTVEKEREQIVKEMDTLIYTEGTKELANPNKLTKYCAIHKQGNLFFNEVQRDTYINWSSSKQVKEILSNIGIEVESTDEASLQAIRHKHPIAELLLSYRQLDKLASSFGTNLLEFINPATGRVHMDIWQILSTGRISTSMPNLNQIPAHGETATKIRSAFVPQKGWKIVGGDYSQMELKVIAELSQDPVWLDAFNTGKDLHSELAALTFGIPIEDVRKPFPLKPTSTYRDIQKTVSFGLAYGMSEFKLAENIQVPVDEAKRIIAKFFEAVPRVKQFLDMLGHLGKSRGYIRTGWPYRRIRFFPEWKSYMRNPNNLSSKDLQILGSIERKSKNLPIQGDNANVIKKALIMLQNKIDSENLPVNILLCIYDEIQCEVREDFAKEWKVIQEDIMKKAAREVIKSIPVEVDCKISDCWTK